MYFSQMVKIKSQMNFINSCKMFLRLIGRDEVFSGIYEIKAKILANLTSNANLNYITSSYLHRE